MALRTTMSIHEEDSRARTLATLVPQLPEVLQKDALHCSVLSTFWADRGILLDLLQQFFFVLSHLEGPRALIEVERAILDTAKWFP